MYILVNEKLVIATTTATPADPTNWIAYDGEIPAIKEYEHLEYKDGKVIVIDDRIEQVSALRKAAYIARVDPITAEIERLKEMGGTEDELESARHRRVEEVAAIKAEYPYPTEE